MMATPYARLGTGFPNDSRNMHTMPAPALPRFSSFPGTLHAAYGEHEQVENRHVNNTPNNSFHTPVNSFSMEGSLQLEKLAELDPSLVSMILAEAEDGAIVRPHSPFFSGSLHPKSVSQAAVDRGPARRASVASEVPSRYPRSNLDNNNFAVQQSSNQFLMPHRTPSLAMLMDMAELSLYSKDDGFGQEAGESFQFKEDDDMFPVHPYPLSYDLDAPKSAIDLGFLLNNAIPTGSGEATQGYNSSQNVSAAGFKFDGGMPVQSMPSLDSIGKRERMRSHSLTSNSTMSSISAHRSGPTQTAAGPGLEDLNSAEELISRMLSVDSYGNFNNGKSTVSLGYNADANEYSCNSGPPSNTSPPRNFSAAGDYDSYLAGNFGKSEVGGGPVSNSRGMPPRSASVDNLYQRPGQGSAHPTRKSSVGYKPGTQIAPMSPPGNSDEDTSESEQAHSCSTATTVAALPRSNCNYDLRVMRRRSSSAVLRGPESNSSLNSSPMGSRTNRRHRRLRSQLSRSYQCPMPDCEKRYEAWRSLQAHLAVAHDLKVTKANYELLKSSEFMATMSQPNSPEQ